MLSRFALSQKDPFGAPGVTFGAPEVTFGALGTTFGGPGVTFGGRGGSFERILEALEHTFWSRGQKSRCSRKPMNSLCFSMNLRV